MIKYLILIVMTLPLFAADADRIDSLMKRFDKSEPSVEAVIKKALAYSHISNERFSSWTTRAKNQAWLPKVYVKGRALQTDKDAIRQDPLNVGDFDSLATDITKQRYIEGKAEFDLKKLVFNADELKVNREILNSVKTRKKLIETITKLYFDRRKNQIDFIMSPPTKAKAILKAKMKIERQTSILDALTNGFFKKSIKKRGK